MYKREVFTFLIIFFIPFVSFSKVSLTYTVLPNAKLLSGEKIDNYYKKLPTGGFNNLINDITKDIEVEMKYIPYDNYSKTMQYVMINSNDTPEIMLGATFCESATKYIDYIPFPIYTDYPVLVISNKLLPNNFKFSNDFIKDIKNLNKDIVVIKDINIPMLSDFNKEYIKDVFLGFEQVFMNEKVFIAPKTMVDDYIEKNKDSEKIKSLKIIDYINIPINYFVVINKKSDLFNVKLDENTFFITKFYDKIKELAENKQIKSIIEK